MGKVVFGMTMSLDGYVNDPDGDVSALYPDLAELRETPVLQEAMRNTGAVVMGRHAYDMAQGDFTGYEFQVPLFVVTHHPPARAAKGENDNLKFHFVTDGIASAIARAKAEAGDKDVSVVGGVSLAQQLLNAGLVDELELGIRPVLLGGGLRLFENLDAAHIALNQVRVDELPNVTFLHYRVTRKN